ncbi:unnamed protein product [Darwinula stevensoni]|uniref:Uncharacterized protein n=1 Tax=Darwinula stevensoni TaxID=69355 RepID=A0A7R9AEP3_9CRUS|nr:unnamed protein product [Darwinula stevensoni]CAG0902531.1 unnamed protein product [Darwinula stevensoni]
MTSSRSRLTAFVLRDSRDPFFLLPYVEAEMDRSMDPLDDGEVRLPSREQTLLAEAVKTLGWVGAIFLAFGFLGLAAGIVPVVLAGVAPVVLLGRLDCENISCGPGREAGDMFDLNYCFRVFFPFFAAFVFFVMGIWIRRLSKAALGELASMGIAGLRKPRYPVAILRVDLARISREGGILPRRGNAFVLLTSRMAEEIPVCGSSECGNGGDSSRSDVFGAGIDGFIVGIGGPRRNEKPGEGSAW